MVLSNLQSCPQYNCEYRLRKKLIKVACTINLRNKDKFQKYFEGEILEILPEQLYEIVKVRNFCCAYGNLPILPNHKSSNYQSRGNGLFCRIWLGIFFSYRKSSMPMITPCVKNLIMAKSTQSKGMDWSKEIVDTTRQRYASGTLVSPADATASLKEASDWMIVENAASEELSDNDESASDLFSDEDD